MEFDKFQIEFLNKLKTNKTKSCLEFIESNEELVKNNLGDNANPQTIKNFVDEINNIIVDNNNYSSSFINIIIDNDNKYEIYEKVLNHPYFNRVLNEFKNSNVLLRACIDGNKYLAKWLITMGINPCYQDEEGVTALMYAARQGFDFVISPYLHDTECINLEDNHGNNVLFHYISNPSFDDEIVVIDSGSIMANNKFIYDLIMNSDININHINHKGETVLLLCIKKNIFFTFKILLMNDKINVNICDAEDKTPAMYLTEKGCCNELFELQKRNCNYNYVNRDGQSVMSILISKLYVKKDGLDIYYYKKYVDIMNELVNQQFNFNSPVDKDGNTAFMIMLIVNDMITAKFCAKRLIKLDLSVKNKYGENVTSLCYKLNYYDILPLFKKNPTYDYNYRDPLNQNTLLMIAAINNSTGMIDLLENDPGIINEVNSRKENALIITSKINKTKAVGILLERGIDINHQDYLGNTALHYAVEIQSPFLIHRLMTKNPNIHIKNNDGKTPLDFANRITKNKEEILELLTNPNPSCDIKNFNFNSTINSKYEKKIKSYLIPCANNHYPEFKSSSLIESVQKDLYIDTSKSFRDIPLAKMFLHALILIIFFLILFYCINFLFNNVYIG